MDRVTARTTRLPAAPTRVDVGGMLINSLDLSDAANLVADWASTGQHRFIVTPNVDHYVRWRKSAEFRDAYELADLTLPDGYPIAQLVAWLTKTRAHRVTGADLFANLCSRASAGQYAVSIVGGAEGVAEAAISTLERDHPGLRRGVISCPSRAELKSEEYLRGLADDLHAVGPQVVALCLGSPRQEFFYQDIVRASADALPGVFMGVGAAVDFSAGRVSRAPAWIGEAGFEWLYRLAREPRRLAKRYLWDALPFLKYSAEIIWASRELK